MWAPVFQDWNWVEKEHSWTSGVPPTTANPAWIRPEAKSDIHLYILKFEALY